MFDIVLISEKWYQEKYKKNDIGEIFILSETDDLNSEKNVLYKYTSVNEIYNFIISSLRIQMKDKFVAYESRILIAYSPIGGIGTTTIAVGLARTFIRLGKKVLFVGADNLQSFAWIMQNPEYMESGFENILVYNEECDIKDIKRNISSEQIDILRPFNKSLISLNLTGKDIIKIIKSVKDTNEYDYIIVDASSNFDENTSILMSYATNVLILVGQDKKSVNKLECLFKNINYSDGEKFFFVCNKYDQTKENYLVSNNSPITGMIKDYIEYDINIDNMSLEQLSLLKSLQRIALLF